MPLAITKAVEDAKKNLFTIPKHGSTITHEVLGRFDAARVLLRPASEGTGVIAGGGVRAVLELGGIRDVLAKSLGTTNPINMAKATVVALQDLRRPEDVAKIRGKRISEVLPLQAAPAAEAEAEPAETAPAAVVTEEPAVVEEETPAEEPAAEAEPAVEPEAVAETPAEPEQPAAEAKPKRRTLRRKKDDVLSGEARITQVKSQIGQSERHRGTLRALGLGRIGRSAEHEESPVLAGMLRKVRHLVKIESA